MIIYDNMAPYLLVPMELKMPCLGGTIRLQVDPLSDRKRLRVRWALKVGSQRILYKAEVLFIFVYLVQQDVCFHHVSLSFIFFRQSS